MPPSTTTTWPEYVGFHLHDLRHTHASWLIAQRIPMIAIAGRFGARECVMTMMIYAHVDKLVDRGLLTAGELGLAAPVPTPVVELALGRATRPAEGSACNGGRP
jgi:hypothetical protein